MAEPNPTPPAEPPTPPAPPASPPAPPAPPKPEGPASFSQEEVNAIATREKAEGERAAERKLAEQLGVPVAEAKKILQAHKDAQTAALTEAERAKQEAEQEKEAAAKDRAEAAAERLLVKKERALIRAGLHEGRLGRAVKLVEVDDPAADDAALDKAVGDLKKEMPELFTRPPGAAPSGSPQGTPPAPAGQPERRQAMGELAKTYTGGFRR